MPSAAQQEPPGGPAPSRWNRPQAGWCAPLRASSRLFQSCQTCIQLVEMMFRLQAAGRAQGAPTQEQAWV